MFRKLFFVLQKNVIPRLAMFWINKEWGVLSSWEYARHCSHWCFLSQQASARIKKCLIWATAKFHRKKNFTAVLLVDFTVNVIFWKEREERRREERVFFSYFLFKFCSKMLRNQLIFFLKIEYYLQTIKGSEITVFCEVKK